MDGSEGIQIGDASRLFACASLIALLLLGGTTLAEPGPAPTSVPSISGLRPDGGEALQGGSGYDVSWNATHDADASLFTTLRYSVNGPGAYPFFITAGDFPTGGATYAWPVPLWNTVKARAQVCARATDGLEACRESAGNFTITATPPYFDLLSPSPGAQNVPLFQPIVIGFNPPPNLADISIVIVPSMAYTMSWSATFDMLTIGSVAFLPCRTYTVSITVSGVTKTWTFSTVCSGPRILSITPPRGPTDPILVVFDTPMNPATVTWTIAPPVTLVPSWSTDNRTLTLTPVPAFASCTAYSFTVTGGRDPSGNPVLPGPVPNSIAFTIAGCSPTVALTSPTGGEDWSGGSVHTLGYTTADPDDLFLDVTIEASLDDGATWNPLGTFPAQPTGHHTVSWTLPQVDTAVARVRVCASDSVNPPACDTSGAFAIDSTPPRVISTAPANGETNVALDQPIVITFSEGMNQASVAGAIGIAPAVNGLAYAWSAGGSVLTVSHSPFAPCTTYTVTLGAGLGVLDGSDPGNALAPPFRFGFTTACVPTDTTPPEILHTPSEGAFVGDPITIAATVTDPDGAVQSVHLLYTPVGGTRQNVSMTLVDAGLHLYRFVIPAQTGPGPVRYQIVAEDAAGNLAATQEFTVAVQARPPGADVGVLAAGVAAVLVAAFVVGALVLMRRERRRRAPPPPAPPGP